MWWQDEYARRPLTPVCRNGHVQPGSGHAVCAICGQTVWDDCPNCHLLFRGIPNTESPIHCRGCGMRIPPSSPHQGSPVAAPRPRQ